MQKKTFLFFIFAVLSVCFTVRAQAGTTISRIKQSGVLRCGVRTTTKAYAYKKDDEWHGIDVEICRLAASAVLSRPDAVQIVPVNDEDGFAFLERGDVDILNAATPWTMHRELSSNAAFPAVFYHTALGFIGHYRPEAKSMKDYKGAKVCVASSPFLIRELDAYNRKYGLEMRIMKEPSLARAKELLYLKRCDLLLDRWEVLHSGYFKTGKGDAKTGKDDSKKERNDVDLVILPEFVRTYPTGPYILDNDREFYKLLRWLIYGVIKAEEKGVSSQNIEDFQNTEDFEIQNLLGRDKIAAGKLGVDDDWLYRSIAEQGNYDEIYQRGLGSKSILNLNRTVNKLKKNGGLIDAPDFYK